MKHTHFAVLLEADTMPFTRDTVARRIGAGRPSFGTTPKRGPAPLPVEQDAAPGRAMAEAIPARPVGVVLRPFSQAGAEALKRVVPALDVVDSRVLSLVTQQPAGLNSWIPIQTMGLQTGAAADAGAAADDNSTARLAFQTQILLAAWARDTGACDPVNYGTEPADLSGVDGDRFRSALLSFEKWSNTTRGTSLKEDGLLDAEDYDALQDAAAAAVARAAHVAPPAPVAPLLKTKVGIGGVSLGSIALGLLVAGAGYYAWEHYSK
jgi:hypothetical protein